jgi:hypothetical protein
VLGLFSTDRNIEKWRVNKKFAQRKKAIVEQKQKRNLRKLHHYHFSNDRFAFNTYNALHCPPQFQDTVPRVTWVSIQKCLPIELIYIQI